LPSNTQLATIPKDGNSDVSVESPTLQDNVDNEVEIYEVIYDEIPDASWCSDNEVNDHSETPNTVDATNVQPVFAKCYAAGFRFSKDPSVPHIEDLTVATIEMDVESGHSECLTTLVNEIRTQVQNQVNHAFEAGVKYRGDIAHCCAIQNDKPTIQFPDLLGNETQISHHVADGKTADISDFGNLKRGKHDTKKKRSRRQWNTTNDKHCNGRFSKS
jgi:hypothetical protein